MLCFQWTIFRFVNEIFWFAFIPCETLRREGNRIEKMSFRLRRTRFFFVCLFAIRRIDVILFGWTNRFSAYYSIKAMTCAALFSPRSLSLFCLQFFWWSKCRTTHNLMLTSSLFSIIYAWKQTESNHLIWMCAWYDVSCANPLSFAFCCCCLSDEWINFWRRENENGRIGEKIKPFYSSLNLDIFVFSVLSFYLQSETTKNRDTHNSRNSFFLFFLKLKWIDCVVNEKRKWKESKIVEKEEK